MSFGELIDRGIWVLRDFVCCCLVILLNFVSSLVISFSITYF